MPELNEYIQSDNPLSLEKEDLKGKRILVRVDFNCPMENGKILDNYRIEESLETLRNLKEKNPEKITIVTHLGRPEGKYSPELSTEPLGKELEKLWGEKVILIPYKEDFKEYADSISKDEHPIVMWENIRFWKEEKENSPEFAESLSKNNGIFVNEAFSACHREHASITGVAKILPSYAGWRLGEEVRNIHNLMTTPLTPSVAIVGGAKIDTKVPVIRTLSKYYDKILLGGKVSIEWEEQKEKYSQEEWVGKIVLPSDYEGADRFDIDVETAEHFASIIKEAKKILWNGPMGKFEDPKYRKGSEIIAKAVSKNSNALRIIGGGETVTLLDKLNLRDKSGFVSTGGGAMLEYIANGTLPGLEPLIY